MTKKHKKHKSDRYDMETDEVAEVKPPGIRLVLKVGGTAISEKTHSEHHEKKHKHKKKKKKHKHHREEGEEGERSSKHEKKEKKKKREREERELFDDSVPSPGDASSLAPFKKRARMSPARSPVRRSPHPGSSPAPLLKRSPAPHRASPAPHRTSLVPHRNSPAPHRASPAPHRNSPAPHRASPASHRNSPAPHRISPAPHRASPAQKPSPAPHRASPAHRASPVAHRASPAPLSSRSVTPASSRPITPALTPAPTPTVVEDITPVPTPVRSLRDRSGRDASCLPQCLDYLHRQIQRKDTNGFFAFPVTESIAPGYFSIVKEPMDLSTVQTKIDNNEYASVTEYKKDIKLMCDNCMVYNRPETIYYKDAKRLWMSANKLMGKDKLLLMKKTLSFMANISYEELGIDPEEIIAETAPTPEPVAPAPRPNRLKTPKPKPSKFEAIPDDLTAEEILEQAQEAASEAASNLTLRRPETKFGFLRRKEDGTTTLNILNPDNDGIVGEKEKVVSIGALAGKLNSGTTTLGGFKEDKRNKATPVTYMNYGPFCSYGPTYDSTFATISKNESDLLLSTYGDETGVLYAKSLKAFVENCGDVATKMVDDLLDVLTGGEHSKTVGHLMKKEQEQHEKELEMMRAAGFGSFNALKCLTDSEIDMSFLDAYNLDNIKQEPGDPEISLKLKETSQLLSDLERTQNERLSQSGQPHGNKPTQKEIQLANKVTQELTELAKQATPCGVAGIKGIREAMGITLEPLSTAEAENDDAQSQVLTHLSSEEQPTDLEKDLQEFFEQGPTLRVCDSPSVMLGGDSNDAHFCADQDMHISSST